MNKYLKAIITGLYLLAMGVGASLGAQAAGAEKIEKFFTENENEAKWVLGTFTDAELEELANKYKEGKSVKELRNLWVIREMEMRRADAKAAERLFYVFLSIVLLVLLILFFIIRIYNLQKKLAEEDQ